MNRRNRYATPEDAYKAILERKRNKYTSDKQELLKLRQENEILIDENSQLKLQLAEINDYIIPLIPQIISYIDNQNTNILSIGMFGDENNNNSIINSLNETVVPYDNLHNEKIDENKTELYIEDNKMSLNIPQSVLSRTTENNITSNEYMIQYNNELSKCFTDINIIANLKKRTIYWGNIHGIKEWFIQYKEAGSIENYSELIFNCQDGTDPIITNLKLYKLYILKIRPTFNDNNIGKTIEKRIEMYD